MKKFTQLSLFEDEKVEPQANVADNSDIPSGVHTVTLNEDTLMLINDAKIPEAEVVYDPRDGVFRMTINPILLAINKARKTHDGSLSAPSNLGNSLIGAIDVCDNYLWMENEKRNQMGF